MGYPCCVSRRGFLAAVSATAGLVSAVGIENAGAEELGNDVKPSSLRFLYIDNKELDFGAEQNVVFAIDGPSAVESASLSLQIAETGEEYVESLTTSCEGSLLFTFTPAFTGTVLVDSVDYVESGEMHSLSLSDVDASYRSFVVGSGISVMSVDDGGEDQTSLNVYATSDGGQTEELESIESGIAVASAGQLARSARSVTGGLGTDNVLVVALDPGHSEGSDSGAIGVNGAQEAVCNWKIADACKAELEKYARVRVVMTRERYEYKTIEERAIAAIEAGADVVVSIHLNSAGGTAHGAEVYVPYNASYNQVTHEVGAELGKEILAELERLGLTNRGVKIRVINDDDDYAYANGDDGDYYGIIRYARRANIPGIIVEHAFIDNSGDYNSFLNSDVKLQRLGEADAQGIVDAYSLSPVSESVLSAVYNYDFYIQKYPDVANAYGSNRDLVFNHFVQYGMNEGRQGSADFSPSFYKNANADLRHAFGATMMAYYYHYIDFGKNEGRAGTGEAGSVTTLWRLYNPYTGQHLYTSDDAERNRLRYYGWNYEGVAWDAPTSGNAPVYRLYNQYNGDHHYTMDESEYANLKAAGWTQEGIGFYSDESGTGVPLYRLFNPYEVVGTHHYTLDSGERDTMVRNGWRYEGECWKATAGA